MKKVLILEDEVSIRSFVVINLKRAGYEAIEAGTGREALERLKENPDTGVAILDIMLPDIDGFEVCRSIRATNKAIGIIMLTARTQEMDKVTGLMTGADDYVTKPFDIREVILRVKSILRRIERTRGGESEGGTLRVADTVVDLGRHEVYKGERRVELTPKEFALLEILMRSPGRVFTRSELLEKVWEFEYMGDTRTVDIHIQRLRKKLQDDRFIRTVFGVGYKVAEEEAQ